MSGVLLPPLILELRAKGAEAVAEVKHLGHEVEGLGSKAEHAQSRSSAAFNHLAGVGKAAALGIGGALVAVGAEGFHLADEMSQADATIAGQAQIPIKAATQIGDTFLNTAGKSTFSGKEMADALGPVAGVVQNLTGAALNNSTAMKFMTDATTLAEASGGALNTTTATLASTMQAYHLGLGQAGDASAELFNVSRLTGVGLDNVGTSVNKLHARLGVAAPDLKTVGGLIVDLQEHGVQGSRGIMIVNTALNTLLGGSTKTQATLDALGVHLYNTNGKFIGMGAVLAQLRPKLASMNDLQRRQAETSLFGSSAASALNKTVLAGAVAFNHATAAVAQHETVEKAASAASGSLHGQIEKLHAGFEDIVTIIGEHVVPIVTSVVGWFMKHKTATLILAGVIGGALVVALGAYVSKLIWASAETVGRIAVMVASWMGIGPAAVASMAEVEGAEVGLAATSEATGAAVDMAFGPIGLAIAAIGIAAILLATHWKQVWGWIKSTAESVWNDALKPVFDALRTAWNDTWDAIKAVYDDVIAPVFDFIKKHWGLMFAVVTGGLSFLIQHWRDVWGAVKAVYNGVIEPVVHGIVNAWHAISSGLATAWSVIGRIFGWIKTGIHDVGAFVAGIAKGFMKVVQPIVDAFMFVWKWIKTIFGWITSAIDHIKHALEDLNPFGGPSFNDKLTQVSNQMIAQYNNANGYKGPTTVTPHALGGMVSDGWFSTGERGPELGFKSGNNVQIFPNGESNRMLAGEGSGGYVGPETIEVHTYNVLDGRVVSKQVERQQLRTGMRRGTTYQPYRKGQ